MKAKRLFAKWVAILIHVSPVSRRRVRPGRKKGWRTSAFLLDTFRGNMKTTTATSFLVFTGRPFSGRPCVLELLDYTLLKWLENQLQKTEAEHNILPRSEQRQQISHPNQLETIDFRWGGGTKKKSTIRNRHFSVSGCVGIKINNIYILLIV